MPGFLKQVFTLIFLFLTVASFKRETTEKKCPTTYCLSNEEVLFLFHTHDRHSGVLAADTSGHYLIFRYGTSKSVELEFPSTKEESSWQQFTYSHYFRPGGRENCGMELDALAFVHEGKTYVLYNNYFSESRFHPYSNGMHIIDSVNRITVEGKLRHSIRISPKLYLDERIQRSEVLYD